MNCPVYIKNVCYLKVNNSLETNAKIFNIPLTVLKNSINKDCNGNIGDCSFKYEAPEIKSNDPYSTKVSIYIVDNPYKVKADFLFFPTNIVLTIDDPLLHRMSRGMIQKECDRFQKPIKMGTVYTTSNGGENSLVQAKTIYHAVVAGESRLVNEEDIKSSTRKALLLADDGQPKNMVMIPADCGTHDINDVARVQLSAIKTYLQTNKNCSLKNIFIVMEDKESAETFKEYYNRIFK